MTNIDSLINPSFIFVDVGNSSIKVAFRNQQKWVIRTYVTAQSAAYEINNHPYPVKRIIICSVRENVKNALEQEIAASRIYQLTLKDISQETLDYKTPDTLGIDRYVACYGAYVHSGKAVLVIDAGTACTLDFMDEEGVFRGGVIAPGLKAMIQALRRSAPALPEVPAILPDDFPGKSTEECLQWGEVGLWVSGIKNLTEKFTNAYGSYDLILTGGDAEVLNQSLNVNHQLNKHLIFDGMAALISEQLTNQK